MVLAYDALWNAFYRPDDIKREDLAHNTRAVLSLLGAVIEETAGDAVFDADPKQLSFPDEILYPTTAPSVQKET